jgi:2-polyprenyl-3-methyl-5-hydroxy-6-metoxy-1,4-benzoquinol methylase
VTFGLAGPDLSVRNRQAELMDDPSLPADRHERALTALGRINAVSRAASRLLAEVTRVHRGGVGPVRVLDVACGGGDVLAGVARGARDRGIAIEVHGCDLSGPALDRARTLDRSIVTHRLDALRDELPGDFDVVTSNLFLHHLDQAHAVGLLRRMTAAARQSILVQDLLRTRRGYALAWLGLHTLTRSDVARVDGLRSVRAAFALEEVEALRAEAGLETARVVRVWPERFVLHWRRGS